MGAILNGVEGMGGERSKRLEKEEGRKKEKRRMDEADKSGRSVGVGESKANSEQRASVRFRSRGYNSEIWTSRGQKRGYSQNHYANPEPN